MKPGKSKAASTGTPPAGKGQRPPLPAEEWNFESVPDSELECCIIWEFARESPEVADYLTRVVAIPGIGSIATPVEKSSSIPNFEIWMAYMMIPQPSIRVPFPHTTLISLLLQMVASGLPVPAWRSLDLTRRNRMVDGICPSPLTGPNNIYIDALAKTHLPPSFDPTNVFEHATARPDPILMSESAARQHVFMSIDWKNFDEARIVAAFRKWLHDNRPKDANPRSRTARGYGKKSELKGQLRCLGRARLKAWGTAGEIRENLPEAWEQLVGHKNNRGATPHQAYETLRKATNRFQSAFSKIFPDQTPICLAPSQTGLHSGN